MSEDEIKLAIELLNAGKNYEDIAYVIGVHATTVSRKVRHYEIYGSSLFTKDPIPLTSSCAYADMESSLKMSSPFSSWLSQQRSSPQWSSESLQKLASLGDTLDNLSFYLSSPSDHTSSQS